MAQFGSLPAELLAHIFDDVIAEEGIAATSAHRVVSRE
jgi:hypothetical protein